MRVNRHSGKTLFKEKLTSQLHGNTMSTCNSFKHFYFNKSCKKTYLLIGDDDMFNPLYQTNQVAAMFFICVREESVVPVVSFVYQFA